MEPMTALGKAAILPTRDPDKKRTAHSRWTERHFGWLLAAPGMLVIRTVDLSADLFGLGRVRELRLPGSRTRLRRLG